MRRLHIAEPRSRTPRHDCPLFGLGPHRTQNPSLCVVLDRLSNNFAEHSSRTFGAGLVTSTVFRVRAEGARSLAHGL